MFGSIRNLIFSEYRGGGGTPLANLITGLFLIATTSFLYIDYLVVYV